MPFTNFPQGVTSFGVPLIGGGALLASGNVFWVDSNGGQAAGASGEIDRPFPTLVSCLADSRVLTNTDAVIMVKARHAESITAAGTITISKAGLQIIGLGRGAQRPTFSFTTADTATVSITGASTRITNCIFSYVGFDAVATGISVGAGDCEISYCLFTMADSTNQALTAITLASGANRAFIHHNYFSATTAGAASAIASAVALGDVRIEDNFFVGDFSTACINVITNAWARAWIMRNAYFGANASEPMVELVTGSTGVIAYNISAVATMSAGGGYVADAAFKFENYLTDTAAGSGVLDPTGVTL